MNPILLSRALDTKTNFMGLVVTFSENNLYQNYNFNFIVVTSRDQIQQLIHIAEVLIIMDILHTTLISHLCLHGATCRHTKLVGLLVASSIHESQRSGDYDCCRVDCHEGNLCRDVSIL